MWRRSSQHQRAHHSLALNGSALLRYQTKNDLWLGMAEEVRACWACADRVPTTCWTCADRVPTTCWECADDAPGHVPTSGWVWWWRHATPQTLSEWRAINNHAPDPVTRYTCRASSRTTSSRTRRLPTITAASTSSPHPSPPYVETLSPCWLPFFSFLSSLFIYGVFFSNPGFVGSTCPPAH